MVEPWVGKYFKVVASLIAITKLVWALHHRSSEFWVRADYDPMSLTKIPSQILMNELAEENDVDLFMDIT
jgi:hypothetical protein